MKTKVYGYGMLCLLVMAVCAMEINASCQDKLSNCGTYPDSSCKAPYKAWALANCRKRCNLCSATPPGHGNCHDKILTCDDHVVVSDICHVSTYKQWARDKCAMTCGLCSPVDNGSCQDKLANCGTYADFSCKAPYKAWALANCRKRCNLCGATPPGHGNCHDKILTCDDHVAVSNICQVSTYKQFAKDNCAMTCGFCSPIGTILKPLSTEVKTTTVSSKGSCKDKRADCSKYLESSCKAPYKGWAFDNCRKRCNLCEATPPGQGNCRDKIINCEDHVILSDACRAKYFKQWAKEKCAMTCGFCTPTGTTLKPLSKEAKTTLVSTVPENGGQTSWKSGECQEQGKTYKKGETWIRDCQYRCTCVGGYKEYIKCRGICWHWDFSGLPQCHMVPPAPGKCCPTPSCPANVKLTYPAGYKEE